MADLPFLTGPARPDGKASAGGKGAAEAGDGFAKLMQNGAAEPEKNPQTLRQDADIPAKKGAAQSQDGARGEAAGEGASAEDAAARLRRRIAGAEAEESSNKTKTSEDEPRIATRRAEAQKRDKDAAAKAAGEAGADKAAEAAEDGANTLMDKDISSALQDSAPTEESTETQDKSRPGEAKANEKPAQNIDFAADALANVADKGKTNETAAAKTQNGPAGLFPGSRAITQAFEGYKLSGEAGTSSYVMHRVDVIQQETNFAPVLTPGSRFAQALSTAELSQKTVSAEGLSTQAAGPELVLGREARGQGRTGTQERGEAALSAKLAEARAATAETADLAEAGADGDNAGLPGGELKRIADAIVAENRGGRGSQTSDAARSGNSAASASSPAQQAFNSPARLLRIQLQPESLGTVQVELRMRQGELSVTLKASRPETARMLEEDSHKLSEILKAAGQEPDSVTIQSERALPQIDTSSNAARSGIAFAMGNGSANGGPQAGTQQGGAGENGTGGQNGGGRQTQTPEEQRHGQSSEENRSRGGLFV
ncbi:flagellar hook-length control protein FliK [Afifella marina]|uniref:flagellar hook-length control protein FliK n=1 Tax=Afifella marina TaxID=1080 RepID=UPI001113B7F6|nr:flagellar hook-length control protein FliK [Afifella marina]